MRSIMFCVAGAVLLGGCAGGKLETDAHFAYRMKNTFVPGMTLAEVDKTAKTVGLTLTEEPRALKILPRRAVRETRGTWRRAYVVQDYKFCKAEREVFLRFEPADTLAETIPNPSPGCS
ncbi:MAG: hypothetical protein AAF415_12765 [Pseudomonadota bacterium]